MYRIAILFLALTASWNIAAKNNHLACNQEENPRHFTGAKVTLASPLLEQYDVNYVKLDISLSNMNTDISGSTLTKAKVVNVGGLNQYAFELNSTLSLDSVLINNIKLPSTSMGTDVFAVNLPSSLANGTPFIAKVYYHGTAVNGSGFFTHGINHYVQSTGTNITFTLSDPYLAKDWWACKQSLTDKIDSADLWFTIPNGTKAGSNGRLQTITPIGTTASRYEWKTHYPIDYYLISVSVAPFDDHSQMVYFVGSTDSMPMQNYVIDTATFYPQYKSAIDSTPGTISYLSTLYGRYPFWKEKYGHCVAPLGGGMEHQTMTTLGAFTTPLIAHELGHQWWGNCVTYTSWRDIWLSEGWASYTEQLYVEHFRGLSAAMSYRTSVFNRVMNSANGAVYVDDTTNVYRIFDSRLTYDKGAAVAHMLRYLAPSDSVFFSGLRQYQSQFAYGSAITADFQKVMEAAYGHPLDTFFNQWVYGEGYPTYTATWNQAGNDVFISLSQTTSWPTSVAAFALPVPLKLQSASGDTLIKVYLNTSGKMVSLKWKNAMTRMIIDPNNDIVNRANLVVQDPQLSVSTLRVNTAYVYPNPSDNQWQIKGITRGAKLSLYDAQGRLVFQKESSSENEIIDARKLLPGNYSLSILNKMDGQIVRMLQKR